MKNLSKTAALLLIVVVAVWFVASSALAGHPWTDPPGKGPVAPNKPFDGIICPGCQQPVSLSEFPWVGKPRGEGPMTPNKPIDGMLCPGCHEPVFLSSYPWGENPPCNQGNKPPDGD